LWRPLPSRRNHRPPADNDSFYSKIHLALLRPAR
jgi:hypothetical protein